MRIAFLLTGSAECTGASSRPRSARLRAPRSRRQDCTSTISDDVSQEFGLKQIENHSNTFNTLCVGLHHLEAGPAWEFLGRNLGGYVLVLLDSTHGELCLKTQVAAVIALIDCAGGRLALFSGLVEPRPRVHAHDQQNFRNKMRGGRRSGDFRGLLFLVATDPRAFLASPVFLYVSSSLPNHKVKRHVRFYNRKHECAIFVRTYAAALHFHLLNTLSYVHQQDSHATRELLLQRAVWELLEIFFVNKARRQKPTMHPYYTKRHERIGHARCTYFMA
eukprot:373831-Pyramimonas_sp.AAC.1